MHDKCTFSMLHANLVQCHSIWHTNTLSPKLIAKLIEYSAYKAYMRQRKINLFRFYCLSMALLRSKTKKKCVCVFYSNVCIKSKVLFIPYAVCMFFLVEWANASANIASGHAQIDWLRDILDFNVTNAANEWLANSKTSGFR